MAKVKEWFRKRMVSLKRHPNYIPLVVLTITMFFYSLKMSTTSNAISTVGEPGTGLAMFAIVLSSYLSFISFLGAFPRRQKPKFVTIGLVVFMILLSIGCNIFIHDRFVYATTEREIIVSVEKYPYIQEAMTISIVHIVMLCVSLLLIVLMPLYSKLLKKIDTSTNVDDVEIKAIDLDENE